MERWSLPVWLTVTAMDLETVEFLLSNEGESLLRKAKTLEGDFLTCLERLRKEYPSKFAGAALELLSLREKARKKFALADKMFFTSDALEQSSGETISKYRAERFRPNSHVFDFGCGIGGDTIGLAARCFVTAVDKDPIRLAMARRNVEVYGFADRVNFINADATSLPLEADAAFIDPSRRSNGRRARSLAYIEPSFEFLHRLADAVSNVAIKLSPIFSDDELESFGGEIEFISENGECKEAVVWLGEFKTTSRRATILSSRATLVFEPVESVPVRTPGRYIYEPDPCVIRAHLIEQLAHQIGAGKIDDQIAFLTTDELMPTPFADVYHVIADMPFNMKNIKMYLRELDVGKVIVKKRGVPFEPRDIEQQLKLDGSREIVLILTRVFGKPWAVVCTQNRDRDKDCILSGELHSGKD